MEFEVSMNFWTGHGQDARVAELSSAVLQSPWTQVGTYDPQSLSSLLLM